MRTTVTWTEYLPLDPLVLMEQLRNTFFLLLLLASTLRGQAQTTVGPSSYAFSNGVHPTLSFIFEGTDVRYVESYWRDELKQVSSSVISKKEIIGAAALLPGVSSDTVRILMKAEQRKNSPLLTAHVAIFTTQGYVSPSSDPAQYQAALAFVQLRSTALRRQLAQQEFSNAEKALARLNSELNGLRRDKERALSSIEKSEQKETSAGTEQLDLKLEMDERGKRIAALRPTAASGDEEAQIELKALEKEQAKAIKREGKAQGSEVSMRKKAEGLRWEVKKNEEEQVRKETEIARQTVLVKALQEKLAAIE